MTLDQVAAMFGWSSVYDYVRATHEDGLVIAIYGLGIWESDLQRVKALVPDLLFFEKRRIAHPNGAWLRVDLKVAR